MVMVYLYLNKITSTSNTQTNMWSVGCIIFLIFGRI
uniref:Uncharacterized protein n=1 Tax=Arundo donax TaxID=35708 RepID=A0A0A9H565_ARUDO